MTRSRLNGGTFGTGGRYYWDGGAGRAPCFWRYQNTTRFRVRTTTTFSTLCGLPRRVGKCGFSTQNRVRAYGWCSGAGYTFRGATAIGRASFYGSTLARFT